jgi:hypothetical protein
MELDGFLAAGEMPFRLAVTRAQEDALMLAHRGVGEADQRGAE